MQRVFTERAHLMCPNMCFGIAVTIDAAFDRDKLLRTGDALSEAHPFLRSLLGKDENGYFYADTGRSQVQFIFSDAEASGIEDGILVKEYNELTKKEWDLRKEGMLKPLSFRNETKTILLFVFHHLLADGRGALLLAEEFAACYKSGIKPVFVEEKLIASKDDMPTNSTLPFVSKLLVKRANNQWKKENHRLSYDEYLAHADRYLDADKVIRTVRIESGDAYQELTKACHEHRVSVNDYLMARMYLNDRTDKIVIAYDLREKLSCYRKGALGNYSTAFSVVYKKKTDDIWKAARDVRDLVKKKAASPKDLYLVLQCYADMDGELLDASFAASGCGYDSEAAKFIGTMFFGFSKSKGCSITNLGKFDSENMEEAAFLPPASPAMKKTLGVLSVNGRMVVSSASR